MNVMYAAESKSYGPVAELLTLYRVRCLHGPGRLSMENDSSVLPPTDGPNQRRYVWLPRGHGGNICARFDIYAGLSDGKGRAEGGVGSSG